jgi:hypothetical protein
MSENTQQLDAVTDIQISEDEFLSINGYEIKMGSITAFSNFIQYDSKKEDGKPLYSFKIIFDSLVYEIFNDNMDTLEKIKMEVRKLYRIWYNLKRK